MNKLTTQTRSQILQMLCEGVSIRAIVRMIGASKNTVAKLLVTAGTVFAEYQDRAFRDLPCTKIQVDEIWSFVGCKQKNVREGMESESGDFWTWVSFCATTKLMPSWYIGNRDAECASVFMKDLAGRLANRVQLTSDGLKSYLQAVEDAFGNDIDYAQLVKIYGENAEGADKKYSSGECCGTKKTKVTGNPKRSDISTSFVERQNLNLRMHMRRFTRLTNAFSKKVENHAHAFALNAMYYNFVRIHQTLRVTPAMEAGITNKLWNMNDLAAMIEEWEAAQHKAKWGR